MGGFASCQGGQGFSKGIECLLDLYELDSIFNGHSESCRTDTDSNNVCDEAFCSNLSVW
jgi:hypothetical protein